MQEHHELLTWRSPFPWWAISASSCLAFSGFVCLVDLGFVVLFWFGFGAGSLIGPGTPGCAKLAGYQAKALSVSASQALGLQASQLLLGCRGWNHIFSDCMAQTWLTELYLWFCRKVSYVKSEQLTAVRTALCRGPMETEVRGIQRRNEDASKMATNVEMNVHQGTAKVTDPSEGALGICSDSIMDKNVWPVSMMVFNALNFPDSVTLWRMWKTRQTWNEATFQLFRKCLPLKRTRTSHPQRPSVFQVRKQTSWRKRRTRTAAGASSNVWASALFLSCGHSHLGGTRYLKNAVVTMKSSLYQI